MAGVSSDQLITYVADVATHVSPMSRLKTLAPAVGLEPTTKRLTAARSTTELRRSEDTRDPSEPEPQASWAPGRRRAKG